MKWKCSYTVCCGHILLESIIYRF